MTDPALPVLVKNLTDNQAQLRSEVDRLRERSHAHGTKLQEHDAEIAALSRRLDDAASTINAKLDAIHLSLKEDLRDLKDDAKGQGASIDKLKGAVGVLVVGIPAFFALIELVIKR